MVVELPAEALVLQEKEEGNFRPLGKPTAVFVLYQQLGGICRGRDAAGTIWKIDPYTACTSLMTMNELADFYLQQTAKSEG
jgi:hypothetical protein